MADINLRPDPSRAGAPANGNAAEEPVWDIIELIFFAYRDFVGDPDGVPVSVMQIEPLPAG